MKTFDVIGDLYDNIEGDAPPVKLEGFHVNTTVETLNATPALSPFVVTPEPFRRIWAGDDPVAPVLTVALRFDSEEQALKYLPVLPDSGA